MAARRFIWICPLCTKTYRTLEKFKNHLNEKREKIERALANPINHQKVVSLADEEEA